MDNEDTLFSALTQRVAKLPDADLRAEYAASVWQGRWDVWATVIRYTCEDEAARRGVQLRDRDKILGAILREMEGF